MADEALIADQLLAEHFREQDQRAVALAEAELVVERLEIVEIEIGEGVGGVHLAQRPAHKLVDAAAPAGPGPRSLVARRPERDAPAARPARAACGGPAGHLRT